MSLLETIRADQVRLRKTQHTLTTDFPNLRVTASYAETISLLTTLIGEATAVGKNQQRETTDQETIAVVKKFIKNNDEFLKVATDEKTITRLKGENDWLVQYLPKQLTEGELTSIITAVIGEGASNTGTIMKVLKERYDGQYDGKVASALVKLLLG